MTPFGWPGRLTRAIRQPVRSWGRMVRMWRLRQILPPAERGVTCQRLGSDYGGWWVPDEVLASPGWVVSAGAGEDVSFDVELNRLGFSVLLIDPTPRALTHCEAVARAGMGGGEYSVSAGGYVYNMEGWEAVRWRVLPYGLWTESAHLYFAPPSDPRAVSHSLSRSQTGSGGFWADVLSLSDVLQRIQVNHIQILKLDIEGAELDVLQSMLDRDICPEVLCVEFDSVVDDTRGESLARCADIFGQLTDRGYRVAHVERWNVSLFHSQPARDQSYRPTPAQL